MNIRTNALLSIMLFYQQNLLPAAQGSKDSLDILGNKTIELLITQLQQEAQTVTANIELATITKNLELVRIQQAIRHLSEKLYPLGDKIEGPIIRQTPQSKD